MPDAPLKIAVHTQMIAAMKSGDKHRLGVLRMLLSEIKRIEADKPDADPQVAISAYAKTLKKTAAEMEQLKETDRVTALQAEIAVVDEFMPKQIEDALLATLADAALAPLLPLAPKDMGRAIGAVMKSVAANGGGATADAGKVRTLVESKITK